MTEERGKPRQPRDCSPHHSAPRMPGPRPTVIRGTNGEPSVTLEQIEAKELEEETDD
jgi:hypothetical protein